MEINGNGLPADFVYVPEIKTTTTPVNLSHVGIELGGAPKITSKGVNSTVSGVVKIIFNKFKQGEHFTAAPKQFNRTTPTHPIREKGEIPMGI